MHGEEKEKHAQARVFLGQVSPPVTINTPRYTHLQLACIIPFQKAPEA